jgi:hypothetical protein
VKVYATFHRAVINPVFVRSVFGVGGMPKILGRLIGIVVACALAASAAGAYTFTSPEGEFTAEFPAAPTLEKTAGKTNGGTPFDQYTWAVENSDGYWSVFIFNYSKLVPKDVFTQESYDARVQGAVANSKGTLRSQKPIQQSGVQGRDFLIDIPKSGIVIHQRLLWIGDRLRLYQIIWGGRGTGTTPDVEAFLDSFRTLK